MKLWLNWYRLGNSIDTWKDTFLGVQQKPRKLTLEPQFENTQQKSSQNLTLELPIEIIESNILPRLPAKSIGRCICVCKRWKSLILTGNFSNKNLQHIKNNQSLTHHKLVVVDPKKGTFCSRDCKDLDRSWLKLFATKIGSTTIRPTPFEVDPFDKVLILGSLDGLVCLAFMKRCVFMFWNPLTGSYKKLSSNTNYPEFNDLFLDVFGFYFDKSCNDYKLLHLVSNGALGAYIYSRSTDSWRKIQCLKNHPCFSSNSRWSLATLLDDSIYFVVSDTSSRQKCWIIVFDVKLEKFKEIQFPHISKNECFIIGSIVVIKGCIHLRVAYEFWHDEGSIRISNGDLWKMNGDGWIMVASFINTIHFWDLINYLNQFAMRDGNWLDITDDNLLDLDIKDVAADYWTNIWASWSSPHSRAIYFETIVSPNP